MVVGRPFPAERLDDRLADGVAKNYRQLASLREGLAETFTINRHDVPPSLHRCLATTNVIESPQSGVRKKTGNVCRWRDGEMILRWVAGARKVLYTTPDQCVYSY